MKVLLHTCCAPCMIYPAREIQQSPNAIEAYFYNPNIHPLAEYNLRRANVIDYASKIGVLVNPGEYEIKDFFGTIYQNEDGPKRCELCWRLRLTKAAEFAKQNDFDAFTTTLLGSIYQNHELIKSICEELANKHSLKFIYSDYRAGFHQAHKEAKDSGIYCQKYCGCLFSQIEREQSKKKK